MSIVKENTYIDTLGVLLFSSRLLTPKKRLNTNKVFMSLENESGFEQLVLFNFFWYFLKFSAHIFCLFCEKLLKVFSFKSGKDIFYWWECKISTFIYSKIFAHFEVLCIHGEAFDLICCFKNSTKIFTIFGALVFRCINNLFLFPADYRTYFVIICDHFKEDKIQYIDFYTCYLLLSVA